jgi:hypothetical protein
MTVIQSEIPSQAVKPFTMDRFSQCSEFIEKEDFHTFSLYRSISVTNIISFREVSVTTSRVKFSKKAVVFRGNRSAQYQNICSETWTVSPSDLSKDDVH